MKSDKVSKITVVETNNVSDYPPVLSLLENLLKNNYKVTFIGTGLDSLPNIVLNNKNFIGHELRDSDVNPKTFFLQRWKQKYEMSRKARMLTKRAMKDSDILWTCSYITVKMLGAMVMNYKHVMQLMELVEKGYKLNKSFEFPIAEYARKAWKVVVPEENRAYIEKSIWGLNRLPIVLPNKPYTLEGTGITEDMTVAIDIIKNEKKKIILYLGGIWPDRNLRPFAKAVAELSDKYCLYIVGRPIGDSGKRQIDELTSNYGVKYLGSYKAPKHLEFVKYAHYGFLSYAPMRGNTIASINALYCAPNKIYEYAAFGVPMIGNDILGLRSPFEKYEIGLCCDEGNTQSIKKCLEEMEARYDEMSKNCKKFYNDTDLDAIVKGILEE